MDNLHYPSVMSQVLEPGEEGNFRLQRKIIPRGESLRHYDPLNGRIFGARFETDFPIITLYEENKLWMSDSPLELEGISIALALAHGRVLTSGLGIGLFPYMAGKRRCVSRIDVVERSEEVLKLVGNQIVTATNKVNLIHDDLFHFLATTRCRYNFIYLDIWPDIITPIKEAEVAASAAKRCLRPGGEVRVWLQELIDRIKEKLPLEPTQNSGFGLHEPCLVCGKTLRNDYAGVCMDCADSLGVSELYKKEG